MNYTYGSNFHKVTLKLLYNVTQYANIMHQFF